MRSRRPAAVLALCAAFALALLALGACGERIPFWPVTPVSYATKVALDDSHPTRIPLSVDATTAALAIVGRQSGTVHTNVWQLYLRPEHRSKGSVFDSLVPSGCWTVVYWSGVASQTIDTLTLVPGAKTWRYQLDYFPVGVTVQDLATLSGALAGRPASSRFLFASGGRLDWWVVRFRNGTERAIPLQHMGPVLVNGSPLRQGLNPPAVLFARATPG